MLAKIIKTGYKTLDLINYFTCGEDEVRAWAIKAGWMAPPSSRCNPRRFREGFIMPEIMKYEDFVKCGSEAECKVSGKYS